MGQMLHTILCVVYIILAIEYVWCGMPKNRLSNSEQIGIDSLVVYNMWSESRKFRKAYSQTVSSYLSLLLPLTFTKKKSWLPQRALAREQRSVSQV